MEEKPIWKNIYEYGFYSGIVYDTQNWKHVKYHQFWIKKKKTFAHVSDMTKNKVEECLLIWENIYHVLSKNWQKSTLIVRC